MSKTARDRVLQALARALWKIGVWILRRLARWGLDRVVGYLRMRAEHFDEEAAESGKRRAAWLVGRAKRWREVATWLRRQWPRARDVLRRADRAARRIIDEVPDYVPLEASPS